MGKQEAREELQQLYEESQSKYGGEAKKQLVARAREHLRSGYISDSEFNAYFNYGQSSKPIQPGQPVSRSAALIGRDLKKQTQDPKNITTLTEGDKVYKGKVDTIQGKEVFIGAREVTPAEQKQIAINKVIEKNKQMLIIEKDPPQEKYTVDILPKSQLTKNNIGSQLKAKSVFSTYSLLSESTDQKVTLKFPARKVATVTSQDSFLGIPIGKKTERQVVTSREEPIKSIGYVRPFTSKDLNKPEIFGITEPSFEKLRSIEYQLSKKAGVADQKTLRQSILNKGRTSDISLSSIFYNAAATPIRIINKPITSSVAIAAFALSKNIAPGAAVLSGTELTIGLGVGATALSYTQEVNQGGTGSRTLGEASFFLGTAGLLYGAKSARSALVPKTNIKYRVVSKGYAAEELTGVTEKGSILNNKKYVEAFTTKGKTTFRTVHYKGQSLKIVEKGTGQYIKIFKKGKLIGEDFKYIQPGQNIKQSILPELTSRKTLLLDKSEASRTSKLSLLDTTRASYKNEIQQGQTKIKLDFKIADTFRRQIVATDQVIKISGKGMRSVEFIKPEFSFSKKSSYPKDQVILQKVGFGRNAAYQRIDIVAPRVFEKTVFARSILGTVEITKQPISLKSFNLASAGKKGSAAGLTSVVNLMPKLKIGVKSSPDLMFRLSSSNILGSSSFGVMPIFSFSSKQSNNIKSSLKTNVSPKVSIDMNFKPEQQTLPINILKPVVEIDSGVKPISLSGSRMGTISKSKQDTAYIQKTINSNVLGDAIPGSDFSFKTQNPPTFGGVLPLNIPKLSFNIGLPKTKVSRSKGISSKTRYRPSIEGIAFNIRGKVKSSYSPFELRPIKIK